MRLKIVIVIISIFINNIIQAQSAELEKLRIFFRQHPVNPDSTLKEYYEIIWITLTVKDSTITSANSSFSGGSKFEKQVNFFLKTKLEGYRFNEKMFSRIVIPLMVGYFANNTALLVKREWELLSTLKTTDIETNAAKNRAVLFPIFNVSGTYSPPHRVKP